MSARKFFEEYLRFSKKDRIGVLALLILILIIYFLPVLFRRREGNFSISEISLIVATADSLESSEKQVQREGREMLAPATRAAAFSFDPNTLDENGWRR